MRMKRAFAVAFGEPAHSVRVQEVERPRPGADEVLVQVRAAPVNPADLLLLSGRHLVRPSLPAPVGIEGAGVIEELGAEVRGWQVGQKVALPFGGTWSELVCVPASALVAVPPELSLQQAAMLCVNPLTAWLLLEGLAPGAVVVQNAAASALAGMVRALAAARGLSTIDVVRRPEQAERLRALGARRVLVGDEELGARVRASAGGALADRGLDAVAGEATGRLAAAVRDEGSVICYGLLGGDSVVLPAREVVFRGLQLRGVSRLRELARWTAVERTETMARLSALVAQGMLAAEVEASYPLHAVAEAVAHAERPGRSGKILITP